MEFTAKRRSRRHDFIRGMELIGMAMLAACSFGQSQSSATQRAAIQPQINIAGSGVASLDFAKNDPFGTNGRVDASQINVSESSLLMGFAQRLLRNGIGSLTLGAQTTDDSTTGLSNSLFLNHAVLDFQGKRFEGYLGRTDEPSAQIVEFPTLRGDDFAEFTSVTDPFSNGANTEEHRYANVVAASYSNNQLGFVRVYAQHLIDSAALGGGSSTALNSAGVQFDWHNLPELTAVQRLVSYGLGIEHRAVPTSFGGSSEAVYGGATVNLRPSLLNRIDLRVFGGTTFGNTTTSLTDVNDAFRADSSWVGASLRLLHTPYGRESTEFAFTGGYRSYGRISGARETLVALTAAKMLGSGFNIMGQVGYVRRDGQVATAFGNKDDLRLQIGFSFSFESVQNEQIGPRRSLLNLLHQALPK